MRKFTLVLLCSGLVTTLFAQKIEVREPQLIKEAGTEAYYPKFTPDGKTILLTSVNYAGLKSFDLETKQVKQLTSAQGAGFNTLVSDDSQTVYFQAIDYSEDPWGRTSFHAYDRKTLKTQRLSSFNNTPVQQPQTMLRAKSTAQSPVVVYANEDLQIVVEKNGRKTVLTPNGASEGYIWAQLSPDETKIVYTAYTLEKTFICDLSGNVITELGRIHAPQWLNNDWVVGMNDLDDGYVVLTSNIVGITANGKVKQDLTLSSGKIAMYPAISPTGNKIAFNTIEGELYIMDVVVK